tara:strand:- start:657 stop:1463 length:807 start_codon:yes stop_codon:yes gene_type:complete
MKRILSIILVVLISQFQIVNAAIAGEDGEVNLSSKSKKSQTEVKDCFEGLNRGIFTFNKGLDKIIFKPLAHGYRKLPQPLRSGTSNVLNNISNVVTIPNNILQGQVHDAGINSLRLVINTTLGIFGIFDVASYYGIQKLEKEDYGQTLGTMGVNQGCYLVLPVLGPSTTRDAIGSLANFIGGDAWYNVTVVNDTRYFNEADYYLSRVTSGVDFRAKNLEAFDSLERNSLDLYASVKSLYLQDRERKVKNLDETTETMVDDDWEEIDSQ